MKIEIQPTVPNEVAKPFRKYLEKYVPLFPLWMQRVVVDQNFAMGDALRITVRDDYRHAFIEVGGDWLRCDNEEREQLVIHEIVHCFTSPLKQETENWMQDFQIEDNVRNAYMRQVSRVSEQVTQDFAYSIKRLSESLRQS